MEISVTRGLNELKLLDKRINSKLQDSKFIGMIKKTGKLVDGKYEKEDFRKLVSSNYASIVDLIDRRSKIKSAIVSSNAVTIVDVAGKKMTVAEAIERKNSIEYEKRFLNTLKRQYNNVILTVEHYNDEVEEKLVDILKSLVGNDKSKNIDDTLGEVSKKYREENQWEVVDYLSLEKIINKLEEDIDSFESEVDLVLSESNSLTKINID